MIMSLSTIAYYITEAKSARQFFLRIFYAFFKNFCEGLPRQEIAQVLEACPNDQWRLIFALARYGGLRIPSELHGLTWDDILWDKKRFIVHSPKTEHIEGKETRVVPIFPELEQYLYKAFEQAESGQKKVITICNVNSGSNFRTQASRIVKRAGLKCWPKLFQNMRASRETELAESYPIQVVTDWIGNSPDIAMKHYLQTTEEHFARAVKVAQNQAQQVSESARNALQEEESEITKGNISSIAYETLQKLAKLFWGKELQMIPPRGLEPLLPG
ncbi:MAG: site-specific integrase [Sedimentisphaerales bacterium]|nr:site-specific integrase [Sedimentisphaerales bacterium]